MTLRRSFPVAVAFLLLLPALSVADQHVEAKFDVSSPNDAPFPSDRFTVLDPSNNTFLRVNMPRPATCPPAPMPPTAATDCFDVDEINTLDGFNLQPRIRVPFTGAIDPDTVAGNVFLVKLGDALGGPGGHRVEVNQIVWDPATKTLFAESDEFLDQHTHYVLVVTDGVHDAHGKPVKAAKAFEDDDLDLYRLALRLALDRLHLHRSHIVAASLFTTQSATSFLEKVRNQIKAARPNPVAVIDAVQPHVTDAVIVFTRQIGTNLSAPESFTTSVLPLDVLDPFHAIGAVAIGHYTSPSYQNSEQYIPPVGTRTGTPPTFGVNALYFNLFLPAGSPPASGWPVAIFGHGFTDSKQGAPVLVAASLAAHGIASIAINVVGHGGGPAGTLTLLPSGKTVSAGGRGIDQDHNGAIDSTEGVNAAFPRTIVSNRDGLRQTVIDLMQLVRVLETNGIQGHTFNPGRIFYAGQSFGGIYGTKLLAVEPGIRAGVLNVPGGPIIDIARISPVFRLLITAALAARRPLPLLNGPFPFDQPPFFGFNENIPLRNDPPLVNTVQGAVAIQEVIDNTEWVSQSGNPVAYAQHIVSSPLAGMSPKAVIMQSAKGDKTVPNPTANNIVRAGDLLDRLTWFRNDLADLADPVFPNNPHTFLTNIFSGDPTVDFTNVRNAALAAQAQMATFFVLSGASVLDPDGAGPLFEVPISHGEVGALEELNFLP